MESHRSAAAASVIIPVHNGEATLGRQLGALASQDDAGEFEVVVVLNRCSDASEAVARAFAAAGGRHRIVTANRKPSAGHARNAGVAASVGRFLLFCDADDVVDRRWVAAVVAALEEGEADFVGGRIVVDRGGLPGWLYRWRYEGLDGRCLRELPGSLPYALSASLGCRRDAFVAVGGFDETFPGAGSEDKDLAFRLLRAGYRIGEAPTAVTRYEPRRTVRAVLRQVQGYARGQALLAAKEGTLGPRPTERDVARRLVRTAARQVVREHEWRPHAIGARVLERYFELRELRRLGGAADDAAPAVPGSDFAAPVGTPIIGGLAFRARPIQARWYQSGGVEGHSLRAVDALVPPGGVFVDGGANVGVFTVAAARRVGRTGRVIAFEPDTRTRCLLERNVERHGVDAIVDIRAEALGDVCARLPFNQCDNDPLSSFVRPPPPYQPGPITRTVVDVVRLDDVVEPPVDMIKLDVEGFEVAALRGATALLAGSPGVAVLVEINPAMLGRAGRSVEDLAGLLDPRRWTTWLVDDRATSAAGAYRPFDEATATSQVSAGSGWYANLLAVPVEQAAQAAHLLGVG